MEILHLLDRLESVLTSGSRIPLTGKTLVEEHECLDIIDQLRVAIPEEVKQARRLQQERDRLIHDAEDEATRIVAHAQEQVSLMSQQHEIVKLAEARAHRILDEADLESAEKRVGADRYSVETLSELESRLSELLSVVRNGIRSLGKEGRKDATTVHDEPSR